MSKGAEVLDVPEDVREWIEDVEAALVDAGISHEAACIDMDNLDPSQWTRMRKTGRIDMRRIALLPDRFQEALAERRARRVGLIVTGGCADTERAERLRRLIHEFVDCLDLKPMVKASLPVDGVGVRRSA